MTNGSLALRSLMTTTLCLALAACGGDDASGGGVSESPNLGDKAEAEITAADGGELALDDAGIKISFPKGALKDDETVTAEIVSKKSLPDAAKLAGNVLDLGPEGLEFAMPVDITIDLPSGAVPDDAESVKLVWLDEDKGEWVELPENKFEGGTVTAKTQHFSMFAVRFVVNEKGEVVQESGMCSDKFEACGGDIEGTWNITVGCVSAPNIGTSSPQCKGQSAEIAADITGDIVIKDGKVTGTITFASMITTVVPKSCLPDMTCPEADPEDPEDFPWTDKGDTCEQKATNTEEQDVDSTYTVDGDKFIVTDNGPDAGPAESNEYCVKGDVLTVHSVTEDGLTVEYTAKRK